MTRDEAKQRITELIEGAVMRAQSIGDYLPDPTPADLAEDILDIAAGITAP